MPITIVVPKETKEGERRVAIVPSAVDKFKKLGANIKIQSNIGQNIFSADEDYKETEAIADAKKLYSAGDMVIKIQPPTTEEINNMKEGSILVSTLYPHTRPSILKELCAKKITCFALEMVPRISRAQSMDILSTQATVIGYKAALIAADTSNFFFPMLSTAAGTLRPSVALIIGIGVAGLQAIASCRRLGARVEAYDVRPETKQEAESLGAKFVDTGVSAVGEGGYARELTEDEKKQQHEVLMKHIAAADIIITTAGVPGRPAPKILNKDMVSAMKKGAVVIDTMAEMGGNCELSKAGEKVDHNGVTIVGTKDVASSMAPQASEMFCKNVLNFLTPMFKEGELNIDWNDDVIKGSAATHDGQVVNEALKKLEEK